jgi:hypothetical protein
VLVLFQEFNKHDREPSKYTKRLTGIKPKTGTPYTCDIGYERFMGPEVNTSFCHVVASSVSSFFYHFMAMIEKGHFWTPNTAPSPPLVLKLSSGPNKPSTCETIYFWTLIWLESCFCCLEGGFCAHGLLGGNM